MSDGDVYVAYGWTAQGQLPTTLYIGLLRSEAQAAVDAAASGLVHARIIRPFLAGSNIVAKINLGATW